MAGFWNGFVYEIALTGDLMIEGVSVGAVDTEGNRVTDLDAADAWARRHIDAALVPARDQKRAAHLAVLNEGVARWNQWRRDSPFERPTLSYLREGEITVPGLDLARCDFSYANLCEAQLAGVHLEHASFHQAILAGADLTGAHLEGANFCRTDLYETDLTGAFLTNANLQGVQLARTRLSGAHLSGCTVYGLSAWDLADEPADEDDLLIRYLPVHEREGLDSPSNPLTVKELRVKGLDLASFMYLTLNNRNIARVIDAAGTKWVLILGRFTERRDVLDAIEADLKEWGYIPIIFDFPPPGRRDLIETLLLLAGLSAFIVVEMTNPRSTPLEVQAIAPNYGVPLVPLVSGTETVPAMFAGLRKFPWVHKPIRYDTPIDLKPKLRAWIDAREALEKVRQREWDAAGV